MRVIRSRAGYIAAIALTWHVAAIASVSTMLCCKDGQAMEHAGMENCPLHSKPVCPLHGDNHGTHECDCPTIGCSQTGADFLALFGTVGILPAAGDMSLPLVAGEVAPVNSSSANRLAHVPLSPPPRT